MVRTSVGNYASLDYFFGGTLCTVDGDGDARQIVVCDSRGADRGTLHGTFQHGSVVAWNVEA